MNNIDFKSSNLDGLDILVLSPTPTYPLDYGNRKRIYSVCQQLKERNGRVHFLHYPVEWGMSLPQDAILEMSRQWNSFYLAAPTRHLHQSSEGEDHTIDEWWDYAIGDYLKWLFERQYFDVFIVNYTYLSKAFEFAPEHVFCILDTHDKFSGRRELLGSQGIAPEFFHTTEDQEKIALDRADLVWAIKKEEEEFFRKLTKVPVETMVHIEPIRPIEKTVIPEDEDYLVLGTIGARNNINVRNVRSFLDRVLPLFRKYLAPIKIKLAGSMCTELEDLENVSGVELMGRVEEVEEFYSAIDVVLVPMTFSTGLKIKAVEALATGLPIIAHKHAMEGIDTECPTHLCNDLLEIGEYCLELAYDRSKLIDLAEQTNLTYLKMKESVINSMESTSQRALKGKSFTIIVLNEDFLNTDSLVYQQIVQTIYYLRHLSNIIYYVDFPLDSKTISAFKYHNLVGKILLSPEASLKSDLITENGIPYIDGASTYSLVISNLEDFCLSRNVICLWLFALPPELRKEIPSVIKKIKVYARIDVMSSCDRELADLNLTRKYLADLEDLKVVSCSFSGLYKFKSLFPNADPLFLPSWRSPDMLEKIRTSWKGTDYDSRRIIILAVRETIDFAYSLWRICNNLFTGKYPPLVVYTEDLSESISEKKWSQERQFIKEMCLVDELIEDYNKYDRIPKFVIDLSNSNLQFSIYLETINRAGIVTIIPEGGFNASLDSLVRGKNPLRPISQFALIDILSKLAIDREYHKNLEEQLYQKAKSKYANKAGWAKVDRDLTMYKQIKSLFLELNPVG